jgi:hypothetical protein
MTRAGASLIGLMIVIIGQIGCDSEPPAHIADDQPGPAPTYPEPQAGAAASSSAATPQPEQDLAGTSKPEVSGKLTLTPAELAAARDLAFEFGKNATGLGAGTVDEDSLTKQIAKRHKMSVEVLDRIYSVAAVRYADEITKAMNLGAE